MIDEQTVKILLKRIEDLERKVTLLSTSEQRIPNATEVGAVPATGGTFSGALTIGDINTYRAAGMTLYAQYILIENSAIPDGSAEFTLRNDARTYSFALSGGAGDAFIIFDNTAGATRLLIDTAGRLFLYNLRTNPAVPDANEIYVDAGGVLRRG